MVVLVIGVLIGKLFNRPIMIVNETNVRNCGCGGMEDDGDEVEIPVGCGGGMCDPEDDYEDEVDAWRHR